MNPAIYRVHHLERLPLRTPYPAQVARVKFMKSRLPRAATLVIDDGGSRGVGDMFVDAGLDPIRVSIVHGMDVHWRDRNVTVPKATLVSALVARIHSGELSVSRRLAVDPSALTLVERIDNPSVNDVRDEAFRQEIVTAS
jgi:hypothetical protein